MRKKIPQIITIVFLLVFILQIASLIFLLLSPSSSQAISFTPQVDIGADVSGSNPIGQYIKAIYNYAIGVVGILATVVMMIGGIVWITAGGNQTRVGEAKAWIGASLSGLVLALTAYTILTMISPSLVNFKTPNIPTPQEQAGGGGEEGNTETTCCSYAPDDNFGGYTCTDTTISHCTDTLEGTPNPNSMCVQDTCTLRTDDEHTTPGCCQHRVLAGIGTSDECEITNSETSCTRRTGESVNFPVFYPGDTCTGVMQLCDSLKN